jgi:outer membrane immunogenic protein
MRNSNLIISAAAVSAIFGIGAASAADLPARTYTKAPVVVADPIYNWSGFYVGGSIGYSSRRYDDRYANFPPDPPFPGSDSGGVYGAQVGAQYQWSQVVIGIEYSYNDHFGRSNFDNVTCANLFPAFTCRVSTNAVQTLGGKLGWAGANNWLFYASGGWAQTRVSANLFTTTTGAVFDFTNGASQNGYYAGAGFDYAIWKGGFADLIVGAEYQHIWINSAVQGSSIEAFNPAGLNARSLGGSEDMVRAKLSVKFNPFAGRY